MTPLERPEGVSTPEVIGVAALARYLRGRLEGDPVLQGLWVRGEIGTYKLHPPSGHRYLTLREGDAALKAVMFKGAGRSLAFEPEPGMEVLVRGRITLYERDGAAELIVDEMQPYGVGARFLALEQLRRRLEAEGLFDPGRRRPLPLLPRRVGVVTSASGAALRDILSVVRRRAPGVAVVLAPATVQGAQAPAEIVAALDRLGRLGGVDVVIVGRGGGATEDLAAFDDEAVVRAVAACPVPVVAAVGHQTDFTLVDHAADRRAPTPSAAAELVVPDVRQLAADLTSRRLRLAVALRAIGRRRRERLSALLTRPVLRRPQDRLSASRQALDSARDRLAQAASAGLERRREALAARAGRLQALSPLAVLARGYAVVRDAAGMPVRSARDLRAGDRLTVALRDGSALTRVEEVRTEDGV